MLHIRHRRRTGFTLIELLVVIAIIAVLVGLLLPAVQKVREAANRSKCQNNMKQLALGIHGFHDAHGYLPVSTNVGGTQPRVSWLTQTLPYIDQDVLYSEYDFTQNWYDPFNLNVTTVPLKVVQCPSAPDCSTLLDSRPDPGMWGSMWVPTSDYGATAGVGTRLVAAGFADVAGPGVLQKDTKVRLSDVTDGTSNTIMLAEDAARPQIWQGRSMVPGSGTAGLRVNGGGWSRAATDFTIEGFTLDGTTSPGPCAINCANGQDDPNYPDPYYGNNGSGATYAFHDDGANTAFADGSVHFISKQINIRIYARLVTRNGNEKVSATDFDY
jgi:prepilin-type N-terminal cleavage/methylation domain-containing protein/prepilin-type processing-associated H-X9-DG protein